ncbi:MAG: hypothetical protein JWQ35_649, partial [Bacteriovoracaceae bacterium]|nr:hypothetical protein [Bacteriovoracaceae bacterium]
RKQGLLGFYFARLKCKGTVTVDEKSYDCAPFAKKIIERRVNNHEAILIGFDNLVSW